MLPLAYRVRVGLVRALTTARYPFSPRVRAQFTVARYVLAHAGPLSATSPPPGPIPATWPFPLDCELENNCMGYALHARTGLLPGVLALRDRGDAVARDLRASGSSNRRTVPEMLRRDGLLPLTPSGPDPSWPTGWVVLAYVAHGEDFHFIRLDPGGQWSEKPGQLDPCPVHLERVTDVVARPRLQGGKPYRLIGAYWAAPERFNSRTPLLDVLATDSITADRAGTP